MAGRRKIARLWGHYLVRRTIQMNMMVDRLWNNPALKDNRLALERLARAAGMGMEGERPA